MRNNTEAVERFGARALDALVTIGGAAAREALDHARESSDASGCPWIAEAVEQGDDGV